MSDPYLLYDNPLIGRYASRAMAERWGPRRKFGSQWRERMRHARGAGLTSLNQALASA